jgi:cell fate regulator YaaT (PSP1 superfamily)
MAASYSTPIRRISRSFASGEVKTKSRATAWKQACRPSQQRGTMNEQTEEQIAITGNPKAKDISTSYVKRQNRTMRMQMRRFTRLTNGFSKKIENHAHAIALHYMHYNFCRVHQTLRVTPAMEAGVADHVWTIEEVMALLDKSKEKAA